MAVGVHAVGSEEAATGGVEAVAVGVRTDPVIDEAVAVVVLTVACLGRGGTEGRVLIVAVARA